MAQHTYFIYTIPHNEDEEPTTMQKKCAKDISDWFGLETEFNTLVTKRDYSNFISRYMKRYKSEIKRMESME